VNQAGDCDVVPAGADQFSQAGALRESEFFARCFYAVQKLPGTVKEFREFGVAAEL